jgi:adenylate cyclase
VIEGHTHLKEVGSRYKRAEAIAGITGEGPWLIGEQGGILTYAAPIVFKETTVGYTVVSFSKSFISEQVRLATTSVIAIVVFVIVAVSLLSIPLASRLLRPILELFKGTREVALGNFDYRIPEKSKDEIGELVSSFNKMALELKKKELMQGVFNRYVSPSVADEILKDPERITLGGDRRHVTVFFADIRQFTTHASRMTPEETVEALNRYFTLLTEIVFRFQGTIDKFIGDAVMGVFGSPIRAAAHLEQGIKTVIAIQEAVKTVNISREERSLIPFQMGIGLDTGEVIVGNMGSQVRMEYTAVGEAVNMAARLADMAGAGEILVTREVYESVIEKVEAREAMEAEVKGFSAPVHLYNIEDLRGVWKVEVKSVVEDVLAKLEREEIAP